MKKLGKRNSYKPDPDKYIPVMRGYRFHKSISQAEMAEAMGIRQQLYSNVETGKTMLSIEFANKFRELTGINLLTQESSGLLPTSLADTQTLEKVIHERDMEIVRLRAQIDVYREMMNEKSRG